MNTFEECLKTVELADYDYYFIIDYVTGKPTISNPEKSKNLTNAFEVLKFYDSLPSPTEFGIYFYITTKINSKRLEAAKKLSLEDDPVLNKLIIQHCYH